MNRLFIYLGRLAVILVGFACATFGASAFLHLLILGDMQLTGDELALAGGGLLVSVPFAALFVGYFALIPAAIAIAVAEVMGLRSWLYFALAGGAAGLAVVYLARLHTAGDTAYTLAELLSALAGTGMVGGLCYWAVAGRRSGFALDRAVNGRTLSGS